MGYRWLDFCDRPEHLLLLGLLVFAIPLRYPDPDHDGFAAVYRLVGTLVALTAVVSLADWGLSSYLPGHATVIERCYEFAGLALSAAAIYAGIRQGWTGVVNAGAVYFAIFLFTRLYRWWWDWMPRYLFFAVIGVLAIGLVAGFQRLRKRAVTA